MKNGARIPLGDIDLAHVHPEPPDADLNHPDGYHISDTEVLGFKVGDRVNVMQGPGLYVGDYPYRTHVISGFYVYDGIVMAAFAEVSEVSGSSDMSCPVEVLTRP